MPGLPLITDVFNKPAMMVSANQSDFRLTLLYQWNMIFDCMLWDTTLFYSLRLFSIQFYCIKIRLGISGIGEVIMFNILKMGFSIVYYLKLKLCILWNCWILHAMISLTSVLLDGCWRRWLAEKQWLVTNVLYCNWTHSVEIIIWI